MSYNIKFDHSPNGCKIIFGPLEYFVDLQQSSEISAFTCEHNIKWKSDFDVAQHIYYLNSYSKKNDIITIIDVLYGKNKHIIFKNNNMYDLRYNNVIVNEFQHKYDMIIRYKFKIKEFIQGHYRYEKYYNPVWRTNNDMFLVFCEPGVLIVFNEENYNKYINIKNNFNDFIPTWNFVFKNGGMNYSIVTKYNKVTYTLHKYIDHYNIYCIILNEDDKQLILPLDKDTHPAFYDNYSIQTTYNKKNNSDIKKLDKIIKEKYNAICAYTGHRNSVGVDAHIEKNRKWKIFDETVQQYKYLMYCENDTIVTLDKKAIKNIKKYEELHNDDKKITWYKMTNGYIAGRFKNTKIYMHQVIMNHYGNGRGTSETSVDHIDRNPLNNMYSNLRIASREEQEQNTKGIMDNTKRNRKHNAKPLPEGITHDMMAKYVVYYKECYNKEKQLYREFFKVEKHPNMLKPWATTKSGAVSIMDKLNNANEKVAELNAMNNDI